jgi:hypothetical protein
MSLCRKYNFNIWGFPLKYFKNFLQRSWPYMLVSNQVSFYLLWGWESNLALVWTQCRHRMKLSSKLALLEAFKVGYHDCSRHNEEAFFMFLILSRSFILFDLNNDGGCMSYRLDLKTFEKHCWKMILASANNYLGSC